MKTGTVYALHECGDRSVRYVGQTTRSLDERLRAHLHVAATDKASPVYIWMRAVLARGGTVTARPLLQGVPEAELRDSERKAIADALAMGEPLTNYQHASPTAFTPIHKQEVDYTAPTLAGLLSEATCRRVTEGEAITLMVRLFRWALRRIDHGASNRLVAIQDAATLPMGHEQEVLARVCQWPKKDAAALLNVLASHDARVLRRTGECIHLDVYDLKQRHSYAQRMG